MKTARHVAAFLIVAATPSVGLSQAKLIRFADKTTLAVKHEQGNAVDVPSGVLVGIEHKEFAAAVGSIGKAVPPLGESTLRTLSRTNRPLALKIAAVRSAYQVVQGGTRFYFAAFNTVKHAPFRGCTTQETCRVKCQALLITVKDRDRSETILIITAMRRVTEDGRRIGRTVLSSEPAHGG